MASGGACTTLTNNKIQIGPSEHNVDRGSRNGEPARQDKSGVVHDRCSGAAGDVERVARRHGDLFDPIHRGVARLAAVPPVLTSLHPGSLMGQPTPVFR